MRKMDQANGVDNGLSTSESPMAVDMEPTDKIAFTTEQRYQAIVRILRVVATLGDIGCTLTALCSWVVELK